MATPSEKLAASLEFLRKFQNNDRAGIIRTTDLTRTHRERLLLNGFIREIIKGWYIATRPGEEKGESTSWYASFWKFCAIYLNERFTVNWCISPDQSLLLHSGNWGVPRQLIIRSPEGQNNVTNLIHGTSLLDVHSILPAKNEIVEIEGIRLLSLPSALVNCSQRFYSKNPTDIHTALAMIRDSSNILTLLLEGGHGTIAGRLAGAFRAIGRERIADDIIKTMQAAGYDVQVSNPFTSEMPHPGIVRDKSPYVHRIKLMWQKMREPVLENFPIAPGLPKNIKVYMKRVEDGYSMDAYNSLSIEGYRVTPDIIERVRSGKWNPDGNETDKREIDALAARGYWQAFQAVRKSMGKVLKGENPGRIADEDHGAWYREMFTPAVTAGILKPSDLAGYRNGQVYISNSMHVPLNSEAVRDVMPAFFELLQNEKEPAVNAVLGHFIFVYIHPYMDGNGRIGRFLMNVMLASGGYPWTVIPVEKRKAYMEALEKASVEQNIILFARFMAKLVNEQN